MVSLQLHELRYPGAPDTLFEQARLHVPQGGMMGLIGPNGAGKTTLFHQVMENQLLPCSGEIQVDCPPAQRQMVLQHAWLPWLLTPRELLRLFLNLNEKNPKTKACHFEAFIGGSGRDRFQRLKNRRYGKLSSGERQWFSVALGLFLGGSLVLLDEPTSGLDPESRFLVWESISQANNEGKTILVSSHLIDEIAEKVQGFYLIHQKQFRFFENREAFIQKFGGRNSDEAFVNAFNP